MEMYMKTRKQTKEPKTLSERAKQAVTDAYRKRKDSDYGKSVIYTDAMHELLTASHQLVEARDGDPLCLFHYFKAPVGDWYIYAAERTAHNGVVLYGWCDLFRDGQAEQGPVLLSDLEACCGRLPFVFPVELDRFYQPERLSKIMARYSGAA
jgi:hypothetical protein